MGGCLCRWLAGVPGRGRRYASRGRLEVTIRADDGHVTAAAGADKLTRAGSWYTDWCWKSIKYQEPVMTVYQGTSFTPELTATGYALVRAGVKVSAGTCEDLAGSLRGRHDRQGTGWRLLSPLSQAVLVIAFLRTSLTYAELAAGFGISPATCWREVAEGVSVLADRGRRISLKDVARLAVKMGWDYLIVDGVHVPAVTFGRKTGGQRAFYSGKHKRHGLNVQTVCSPDGELLWAAAPQPGATVDVTAARKAGIAAILTSVIGVLADLGYLGWDEAVIAGRRRPRGKEMTADRKSTRLNSSHVE